MSFWDDLGKAVSTVGHVVETAVNPASAITESLTGTSNPVNTLLNPTDAIFSTLSSVAAPNLAMSQGLLEQAINAGAYAAMEGTAKGHVKTYQGLINAFVNNATAFSGLTGIIKSSASSNDSAAAQKAIKAALGNAPAVMQEVEKLASSSLFSLTFEVGGQADLIAGVDGAVGFAVGVPDIIDAKGYASAGITLGAEEGGDLGIVVGMSVQKPDDQSGPFAAVIVQVDGVLGGGIAVSFNLPDMSFGGVSVAIEAGEELQVAGSAGYTWAL